MIKDILKGITDAIYSEFGDGYEIYTERVEQGLQEPCFFVILLNPTNRVFLSNRRRLTNLFSIQYFPSTNTPKIECAEVFERLVPVLDCITVGDDLVNGSNMEVVIDDVMTITVNYDLFTINKETVEDQMESFESESRVNE